MTRSGEMGRRAFPAMVTGQAGTKEGLPPVAPPFQAGEALMAANCLRERSRANLARMNREVTVPSRTRLERAQKRLAVSCSKVWARTNFWAMAAFWTGFNAGNASMREVEVQYGKIFFVPYLMNTPEKAFVTATGHLAQTMRGRRLSKDTNASIAYALLGASQTSKQGRAAARNVLATLRQESVMTTSLQMALQFVADHPDKVPTRGWWRHVMELMHHGAYPGVSVGSWTVMRLAVAYDKLEAVSVALECGVDPDDKTGHAQTVLVAAAKYARESIAAQLLSAGADPNIRDDEGGTALMWAAQLGGEGIVARLLEARADPNLQASSHGQTALLLAANRGFEGIVSRLLAAGADPNLKNAKGETALVFAATRGHDGIASSLLASRADPNLKTAKGDTALMEAAYRGHEGMVADLLKAKADPNSKNAKGDTALILAASRGHGGIVARLLKAKADPTSKNARGLTALEVAATPEIASVLHARTSK